MDLKKTNAQLTIFFMLLFASVLSYGGKQENSLAKAIGFYDNANFIEAEKVLKKLLDEKPDHLMVNYYYGACRTENGHYGTNEIIYLLNGSTGESPLKTDYYLGIQYHAKNRWDNALKHYNRYKGTASEDQVEQVNLSEKIQQCYEKINPFVAENEFIVADVHPAALPRENEIEEYSPLSVKDSIESSMEFKTIISEDTLSGEAVMLTIAYGPDKSKKPAGKIATINFTVDNNIKYLDIEHFRTEEGKKLYSEATDKQKELDSRIAEIDELRKKYGAANSYNEKQAMGEEILAGETDIYSLQNQINQLMMKAKQKEVSYWSNASIDERESFLLELETYNQADEAILATEIEYDTTEFIDPTLLLAGKDANPAKEENLEDELIYKIQLGAYSRGLPNYVKNLFKKLSYIRKIENYTDDKGVVVYTTGNLSTYEDAVKMQNQVRQEGVEDAFVVPYFNGKRITLKEAKEIEAGK